MKVSGHTVPAGGAVVVESVELAPRRGIFRVRFESKGDEKRRREYATRITSPWERRERARLLHMLVKER